MEESAFDLVSRILTQVEAGESEMSSDEVKILRVHLKVIALRRKLDLMLPMSAAEMNRLAELQ